MAVAVGQTSKGRSGSAATIATGSMATTSGSTFVIGVVWSSGQTFTSLVDSNSNSYTQLGSEFDPTGTGDHARYYYCQNGVGSASHTATLTISGATSIGISFVEITGAAVASFDLGNGNADAASPYTSPSISTTQSAEMLISFIAGNSGSNPATHAESTGFTIQAGTEETNGVSFWTFGIASRVVAATGSYNSSFTETGASRAAVFIAGFKAAQSIGARKGLGPSGGPRKNRLRSTRSFETSGSVGVLTGTASIVFTPTGTLTGAGALTGSATLTFSPTSTLTGSAPVTGSTSLTFSPTGTLIGIGALTGATSLTFSPTSTLTGSGALTGSTTLTFAPTSTLTGTGALTGTASITFSPTGTLADASGGSGALIGSSSFTFTVTGTLTGSGALAGVTTLTFTPTGILTDANGPVVNDPYPKPAGGSRTRQKQKRRLEVEIDGQIFPVESLEQAQALLDRARELATKRAEVVAEQVVRSKLADKPPVNKPIRVPVPQLHTDNQELVNIVIQARHAIARIYREQALAAEIRLRLELADRESDEDDLLLLL